MEDFLKGLFPKALVNEEKEMGRNYFSFSLENNQKWIHIPAETMSERERKLVSQIASSQAEEPVFHQSPWAPFLSGETSQVPAEKEQVQLLQFMIEGPDNTENFDQSLWLEAFINTLEFVLDGFFITSLYGVLVLDVHPSLSSADLLKEIEGVLNVLDDDFSVQSRVYLGQSWPADQQLPILFQEEQKVFQTTPKGRSHKKMSRLPEVALEYYTKTAAESILLRQLKKKIREMEGSRDLILSMWNNQGNISKAAAELYMHRNTLQYRLDRFLEITGLNLKAMDDLFLAYLAVRTKTSMPNFELK